MTVVGSKPKTIYTTFHYLKKKFKLYYSVIKKKKLA